MFWPFGQRKSTLQPGEIVLTELPPLPENQNTRRYLSLLLMQCIKRRQFDVSLSSEMDLPDIEFIDGFQCDPKPSISRVFNRLKVMMQLDPVRYSEPREGDVKITVDGKPCTVHGVFEDLPISRVTLSIQFDNQTETA